MNTSLNWIKAMVPGLDDVTDQQFRDAMTLSGTKVECFTAYDKNLDKNIENLVDRLRKKAYKPKPARRIEIPKDNGKTRPLSIYCYEDKLVQEALKRILEAVFEPCFYDEMMGFRPNRGCHMALRKLNYMIEREKSSYILDADIKSFFNHLDHKWIMKFVESKIKDPNIARLLKRILKSGVI